MSNPIILNTSLDTEMFIRNGDYIGEKIGTVLSQIPKSYSYIKDELKSYAKDLIIKDVRCTLFCDLALLMYNSRNDKEMINLLFNNIKEKCEIDNFMKFLMTYSLGRSVLETLIERIKDIENSSYLVVNHVLSLKRFYNKFSNPIKPERMISGDANIEDLTIVPYRKLMFEKRDKMYSNMPFDFKVNGMRFSRREIKHERMSMNRDLFSGNVELPTYGNTVILTKHLFRYMNLFKDYEAVQFNPKDFEYPISGLEALENFKYIDIDVFAKAVFEAVSTDEENAYKIVYKHIDDKYKVGYADLKSMDIATMLQKILLEIALKSIESKMYEKNSTMIYRWICEELDSDKIYVYKPSEESRRYLRRVADNYYKFRDKAVVPNIVYLAISISKTLDEAAVADHMYSLANEAEELYTETKRILGIGGR